MTDLQYDFLLRYKALGCPLPSKLSGDDLSLFRSCESADYIRQATDIDGNWFLEISDFGTAAMLEYRDQLQRKAEEEAKRKAEEQAKEQAADKRWRKDSRRSWVQFWLNALFGLIGFVAGLLMEHYFAWIELISRFLRF